jgi:triacylglycerol esterase/lipase EstA (alpha/beta hydrolase family)
MRVVVTTMVSALLILAAGSPASADSDPGTSGSVSLWEVPTRSGPAQTTHHEASRYVRDHPGSVPPGVNDFSCTPSATHPEPVVLLHGTDSSAYSDFAMIGPRLAREGFCVFAVNFGGRADGDNFGTEDIVESASQVGDFAAEVRAATGARKIDVVGYSQGATVGRYFVNQLGGSATVDQWVGLASPTYGSTLYGIVPVVAQVPGALDFAVRVLPRELVSRALWQQVQGSPLLEKLNDGGNDTAPGVGYTTIGSRVDEVIQPFSTMALKSPGATNLVVQDGCPTDLSGHFRMPYDDYAVGLLLKTLDPASAVPACTAVALGAGILEMVIAENS